ETHERHDIKTKKNSILLRLYIVSFVCFVVTPLLELALHAGRSPDTLSRPFPPTTWIRRSRDVRATCPPALRCLALTLLFAATARADQGQPPPTTIRGAKLADVPLAEKLRSPRDTLQTLYYAVDVYDYVPSAILDAVA